MTLLMVRNLYMVNGNAPIPYALLAEKHRTVVLVTHKSHYDEICRGKDHYADQAQTTSVARFTTNAAAPFRLE